MQCTVTLFNQHAACGIKAAGRSRRQAFFNALDKAGAAFLNHSGDWASEYRKLFEANMSRGRMNYASLTHSDPRGISIEIRKV